MTKITDPPAIELAGVDLTLGGHRVLDSVDLTVARGEFLGVIGPNGGGKTVLLELLLGLHAPDRGRVAIFGQSPKRARGRMAYVPQFPAFELDFPIATREVVLQGRLAAGNWWRRPTAADRRRADALMTQVGLESKGDRLIGELSGGQRQRALLARALMSSAELLFLDEPMANLDPAIERMIFDLLDEISRERTILLVSHDIGVMVRQADRIACVNRSCQVETAGEALSPAMIEHAFGPLETLVPALRAHLDAESRD